MKPRMFCDNPNCFLHNAVIIGNTNIVTVESTDVRRTACLLSHFSGMTVILCDYCRAKADAGTLKITDIKIEGCSEQ